jgi:glyoxylase-like metal-dependent hydrolase (beta-lactamase superfamily II)
MVLAATTTTFDVKTYPATHAVITSAVITHPDLDHVTLLAILAQGPATQTLWTLPTSYQEWRREDALPRVPSVEARVMQSAQDETFDLSLIRDGDLLP